MWKPNSPLPSIFNEMTYTEEERRGIDKYLYRRLFWALGALILILVLYGAAHSCDIFTATCARSEYIGTWVLAEDYYDGFDRGDCLVEIRIGSEHNKNVVSLYRNGNYLGDISNKDGQLSAENNLPHAASQNHNDPIIISIDNGMLTLEYNVYPSYNTDGTPYFTSAAASYAADSTTVTETYIRISADCNLTEDQRAELY